METLREKIGVVLGEVATERERQEELKAAGKFLWSCADNEALRNKVQAGITDAEKFVVLGEETGEVAREVMESIISSDRGLEAVSLLHITKLRAELIQVAAVCVAWVESIDARGLK